MSPLAYRPLVAEILINIRTGVQDRKELRKCGCPSCLEALRILQERE